MCENVDLHDTAETNETMSTERCQLNANCEKWIIDNFDVNTLDQGIIFFYANTRL